MITLQKIDDVIKFTFQDNDHYLQNGTIEVPLNSLTLVTDESEMFTFKKSATNDVFISGLYTEIGMTKAELETFYKENMVGSSGGGGGTIYTAGRAIDISTANTISLDLPISGGSGTNSIVQGYGTTANGNNSHAEGYNTRANANHSHSEGYTTTANGYGSHAEGTTTQANGYGSHTEGNGTRTSNSSEHASGQYNISSSASTTFGDSGNTLFSVGNGTSNSARHNAFEIRQNGDIYIQSGNTDIKLQDALNDIISRLEALENNS